MHNGLSVNERGSPRSTKFPLRTAIVAFVFLLLGSVGMFAERLARRISCKDNWGTAEGWQYHVCEIIALAIWAGSMCTLVGVIQSAPEVRLTRKESALCIASLALIFVLPAVLITLEQVLDYRENLTLTERRVLGGVECAFLGLFLLAAALQFAIPLSAALANFGIGALSTRSDQLGAKLSNPAFSNASPPQRPEART